MMDALPCPPAPPPPEMDFLVPLDVPALGQSHGTDSLLSTSAAGEFLSNSCCPSAYQSALSSNDCDDQVSIK